MLAMLYHKLLYFFCAVCVFVLYSTPYMVGLLPAAPQCKCVNEATATEVSIPPSITLNDTVTINNTTLNTTTDTVTTSTDDIPNTSSSSSFFSSEENEAAPINPTEPVITPDDSHINTQHDEHLRKMQQEEYEKNMQQEEYERNMQQQENMQQEEYQRNMQQEEYERNAQQEQYNRGGAYDQERPPPSTEYWIDSSGISQSPSYTPPSIQLPRHASSTNTTGLIILGMHRSGTSMITGSISTCLGIPTSSPEMAEYMAPATYENIKGYFERSDTIYLNIFMLSHLGLDTDGFAGGFALDCESSMNERHSYSAYLRRPAIKAIIDDLTQYDTWILKDPRIVITYGYYHRFINNPVFIIPVRNPIEVARSMAVREPETSPILVLQVWETYVYNALRWSTGGKRIFLFHDEFMANVTASLSNMYHTLRSMDVTLPERTAEELDECGKQWVEPGLVHHKGDDALFQPDEVLTIGIHRLYRFEVERYIDLYAKLKSGEGQMWTFTDLPTEYASDPYGCAY